MECSVLYIGLLRSKNMPEIKLYHTIKYIYYQFSSNKGSNTYVWIFELLDNALQLNRIKVNDMRISRG